MGELEVIIRKAGQADTVVPLRPGVITLGRADSNDIVLADIGVSRRHASLTVDAGGMVTVQDLESGNGTWIRGRRLEQPRVLEPGEIVLLDPFTIELRKAASVPRYTPRSAIAQTSAGARLDVLRGPNLAQGSYLVPAHGLSIGRSEYRDVVVLDPAASRHHCDVLKEGDEWWLKDRGSSNGVHVNDDRAHDSRLVHGDVIRIGNTELRFVLLDTGTRTEGPKGNGSDPSIDLSLPMPVSAHSETPQSAARRTLESVYDDPTDPEGGSPLGSLSGAVTGRRRSPWLPLSLGALAVGLIAVAAGLVVFAGALAIMPASTSVALLPTATPTAPEWELDADPPSGDVASLFEQGVATMRQGRSEESLRAFRQILVLDPGNRAAERWSFTAGEHLMLDHMESQLAARIVERREQEAARDALIERLPLRSAVGALKRDHRDDPVVLTRMGWAPSKQEADMARELDDAYARANLGEVIAARDIFAAVLERTKNPALQDRARFGLTASRRALAQQVATDWRLGVEAELQGDAQAARDAYRRVLAVDQAHRSARIRLGNLGNGPDEDAEARR